MIGLSVRWCLGDLARDEYPISEVEKIIGATKCETPEDWENLITDYKKEYWGAFAERAEQILHQLLAEGKIEQPRITQNRWPDDHRRAPGAPLEYQDQFHHSHWTSSEKYIRWRDV